jgi:hypothetical protein
MRRHGDAVGRDVDRIEKTRAGKYKYIINNMIVNNN